jgi:hypothetical protein
MGSLTGNSKVFGSAKKGNLKSATMNLPISDDVISRVQEAITNMESRNGTKTPGIYRLVGVQSKVDILLRLLVDPKERINWEEEDIRTMSSSIKAIFRNLREPILTYEHHNDLIGLFKSTKTNDERVDYVKKIIEKLPQQNQVLLKMILHHLVKVACEEQTNKMTCTNLSVCFGPVFMWSEVESMAAIYDVRYQCSVVELLIENTDKLFPELNLDVTMNESIREKQFSMNNRAQSRNSISNPSNTSRCRGSQYDNIHEYGMVPINDIDMNPIKEKNQTKTDSEDESEDEFDFEDEPTTPQPTHPSIHPQPTHLPNPLKTPLTALHSIPRASINDGIIPQNGRNESPFEVRNNDNGSTTSSSMDSERRLCSGMVQQCSMAEKDEILSQITSYASHPRSNPSPNPTSNFTPNLTPNLNPSPNLNPTLNPNPIPTLEANSLETRVPGTANGQQNHSISNHHNHISKNGPKKSDPPNPNPHPPNPNPVGKRGGEVAKRSTTTRIQQEYDQQQQQGHITQQQSDQQQSQSANPPNHTTNLPSSRCRAVYDCAADHADELSFSIDDEFFDVQSHPEFPGWFNAKRLNSNGNTEHGLIPGPFVEFIHEP